MNRIILFSLILIISNICLGKPFPIDDDDLTNFDSDEESKETLETKKKDYVKIIEENIIWLKQIENVANLASKLEQSNDSLTKEKFKEYQVIWNTFMKNLTSDMNQLIKNVTEKIKSETEKIDEELLVRNYSNVLEINSNNLIETFSQKLDNDTFFKNLADIRLKIIDLSRKSISNLIDYFVNLFRLRVTYSDESWDKLNNYMKEKSSQFWIFQPEKGSLNNFIEENKKSPSGASEIAKLILLKVKQNFNEESYNKMKQSLTEIHKKLNSDDKPAKKD